MNNKFKLIDMSESNGVAKMATSEWALLKFINYITGVALSNYFYYLLIMR